MLVLVVVSDFDVITTKTRKMKKIILCTFLLWPLLVFAQDMPRILSLQEQGKVRDQWLKERVETILPELMRENGMDMWLLISREYNEDPVLKTMLPSSWMSARRTTMLIVYDNGESLETLACARYDVGEVFKKAWDKEAQPDQWRRLAEIIAERDPKKIGVNRSEHFGLADGISSYHYDLLLETLPAKYRERVVSAETLAINWLETRTDSEMAVYQQICRIAHVIIAEGFSDKVIQPGVTTTDDVVWYYHERIRELGLDAWFHPTVDIQRADPESFDHLRSFARRPDLQVIQPGDLVHCDFGITYLGLNTDTQQNAYILRPGETDAPAYLKAAYEQGLKVMDDLTSQYAMGVTGNQALAQALARGKAAGRKPTIYTHPIGYHGHGAGATVGLWDQQGGVPHRGDHPIRAKTAWSIELNNAVYLEEWGKEIRIMLEEDAYFDGEEVRYIDGRQKSLYLIPRPLGQHGQ